MNSFDKVLGNQRMKKYLIESIEHNRVAHAQLFIGDEGIGVLPMAIAYATEVICSKGDENSRIKCENLTHPDLHFAFPNATTKKITKEPSTSKFINEFKNFYKENPYGTLYEWGQYLSIENKQTLINVRDAKEIENSLALKSYEGGYKVMIIWMAEYMNIECANKLLKLLEEPPTQTLFILVAASEQDILPTIYSRCQVTRFQPINEASIKEELLKKGLSSEVATSVAIQSQGNYRKALDIIENRSHEQQFEEWFILWVRTAFRAKGNKASILGLLRWGEQIQKEGRETQKQFLEYCLAIFRQALLLNYGATELVYSIFYDETFKLEKFAPFVHNNNIIPIQNEIENAIYHIERNGNSKIILTDLSIKLTRLLHIPS